MRSTKSAPRIAIDASCGGMYSGGMSTNGKTESDYNLEIALKLGAQLEKAGYQVYYTRLSDEAFSATNPLEDKHIRQEVIDYMGADLTISIGLNQSTHYNNGESGFQIYCNDNAFASYIGMKLLQNFDAFYTTTNLGLHSAHPNALQTESPALFLSLGYITDDEEFSFIQTKEYKQELVAAIKDQVMHAFPLPQYYVSYHTKALSLRSTR